MLSISYFGEKRIRLFYTFLIILGVLLVFMGLLRYRRSADIPGFWERSYGFVVLSERLTPTSHRPSVRYHLPEDRELRAIPEQTFRRGFEEGEELHVYYHPVEPERIMVERKSLFNYQLFLFFGIVLSGFGFRLFVATLIRNFRITFIKENGRRVRPDSVSVTQALMRMPIRKRRVYFLKCLWTDPKTDEKLTFLGEPLAKAPNPGDDNLIDGHKVYIYYLPKSIDRYYIEW